MLALDLLNDPLLCFVVLSLLLCREETEFDRLGYFPHEAVNCIECRVVGLPIEGLVRAAATDAVRLF